MKLTTLLRNTLLALLLLTASLAQASPLDDALNNLESEWAIIYYQLPKAQQGAAYAKLLEKSVKLCQEYPKSAGALFWQAVIKASYADRQDPVSALSAIYKTRELLNQTIAIDPKTAGGSAYVVLGSLYHQVPGWPIAFGDDDEAERMFQAGLKISPNGIDSNFYYGQFLLDKGDKAGAIRHFEQASHAPIRPEQVFADTKLEEEAKLALKKAQDPGIGRKKPPPIMSDAKAKPN